MGLAETIRRFGVQLSFDFDPKKVEAAQESIEKLTGKLKGFAFDVGALTAGLFGMQNVFTANARSLEEQSNLFGIGTDELQQYEYAAKVAANVNRDELVDSFQTLANTMDKARAGDAEARKALYDIGAAAGDSSLILGKLADPTYKVTDAMHDMSKGIQAMSEKSPLAANRLTQLTLGNAKLFNMLKGGPKAIDQLTNESKKNFVINDRMIKQGAEMDRQMSKLWLIFRKFGYEIGFNVMRHLTPMIQAFQSWFQANQKIIQSGITTFLDILADALKSIWEGALMLVKALGPVVDLLGGQANAVKDVVGAWLAFKAISIASSVVGMVTAFAPFLPILLAVTAAVVALHDAWKLLNGEGLKNTWIGQLVKGGIGGGGGILSSLGNAAKGFVGPSTGGPAAAPAGGWAGALGGGVPPSENHYHANTTVNVPSGTSPAVASQMVARAHTDTFDKMMIKAKMDASRNKVQ
jgi:hypothetical protein